MEYRIDEKDRKILEVLKEHGEFTTRQISKKTLLPPTTIHNRIKSLRKEGVIRKYTIDIDSKKTGRGFSAYILISANLRVLKEKHMSQYDVVKELNRIPNVEKVHIVSGGTDIIAFVRAKDVEEYDRILLERIQLIEGIDNTQSLIVLHGD
ncbi:MAG: Lrp/AsnC family transcriptional regulator [Candidatus Aenigmarchaeota archaeon]|nr:Lrp/AsnC family transcriptional regulator [Candidatus Aenigmarchaeota archaeon]